MCDHDSFSELRNRVNALEANAARFDEQIKTLFNSCSRLYHVTVIFGLLMLLAIIYGAVGQRGFNAVTGAASNAAAAQHLPNR